MYIPVTSHQLISTYIHLWIGTVEQCVCEGEREGGHVLPVRQASSFLRTGSSFDAVRSLPG